MKEFPKAPAKNISRSTCLVEWLSDHPLISRRRLCTLIGYDVSSLHKVMNGIGSYIAIPRKHTDSMEEVLKKYGYSFNKLNS